MVDQSLIDAIAARLQRLPAGRLAVGTSPRFHAGLIATFEDAHRIIAGIPAMRKTGPKSAAKECRRLASAARELEAAIMGLSFPSHEALHRHLGVPSVVALRAFLDEKYPHLANSAEQAAKDMEAASPRRGRYRDRHAAVVADYAAVAYQALTGMRPTIAVSTEGGIAGGLFLDLVADLFEILSINASAEHYAKRVIEQRQRKEQIAAIARD